MTVKYKVSDFAKDLNISAKKVLDELAVMGSTGKKNSSTLEENELNYLLEKFSKDNSEADLSAYLNSARQPAPEKKAEQPERPKRRPSPRLKSLQPRPRSLQRRQSPRTTRTARTRRTRRTSSTRSARRRLFL